MNPAVNILLVDDESRNLDVLESVLQVPDYHLIRAQTAERALRLLLDGEFAAIVLDIQMPEMTGLELANLIKQRKRTQDIPIIFLTAYFQEDKDVLEGYHTGAVDYLTKPVNPQILRSKIAVFADLFRKTRALAATNRALEQEVAQRQKAETALRLANAELEDRVAARMVDLVRANDKLRHSEALYRAIGESIDYGVWLCTPDGRNLYASESFLKMVGITQEQCSNFGWGDLLHPDDAERTIASWKECAKNGSNWDIEHRFLGRDGQWHHVLARGVPVKDSQGQIQSWAGINLDISRLKRTEEALREAEHRMRLAMEATAVGIWEWNILTGELRWDAEMFRIYGHAPTSDGFLAYKVWRDFVVPEDLPQQEEILRDTVRRQGHSKREFRIRRSDGEEYRYIQSMETVRKNAQGEAQWVVGTNLDITERKRAEQDVVLARDRALAASRAKDDFLAKLSHELRTPLNPVLLLSSDAAGNPKLPADVRADFAMIAKNVELEARLIDDLLDLTRITQGKLVFDLRPVDLHLLVEETLAMVRADIADKQLVLNLALKAEQPVVRGDDVRLKQILWNVVKNAVKFTAPGGAITIETLGATDPGRLALRITDTGIGMTPGEVGRIFEAFSQGDHARQGAHQFGGLGLGLAISRMLVERHGGTIRATSAGRDRGTTVQIEIPSLSAEEAKREGPDDDHNASSNRGR